MHAKYVKRGCLRSDAITKNRNLRKTAMKTSVGVGMTKTGTTKVKAGPGTHCHDGGNMGAFLENTRRELSPLWPALNEAVMRKRANRAGTEE